MFNYNSVEMFMSNGEVASASAWAKAVEASTKSGYFHDVAKDVVKSGDVYADFFKAQEAEYYAIAAEALKANPLAVLTVVESGEEGQEQTVSVVAQCLPDGVIRLHEADSVMTNPGFMTEAHYEMANDYQEDGGW